MQNDAITCFSCKHAMGYLQDDVYSLRCEKSKEEAREICSQFEYEPGNDKEVCHE